MDKIKIEEGYVPYNGGTMKTIINIILGNVVFHHGQLYATPKYVRKLKKKGYGM
nr:hypothetical protein [uncultured Clostridium sp.]